MHRLLEKGSSRFDNELHGQLERFLIALYDPKLSGDLEAWIDSTKQDAIVFSDWIRTQIQAGRPLDEMEGFATARQAELKATLDGFRATLEQIAPSEIPNYPDSRHWKAIRDLENTVLEARFDLLIAAPLLDDFDARVAAALGR